MSRKPFMVLTALVFAACESVSAPDLDTPLSSPSFAVVTGTEIPITNNFFSQFFPRITGDQILWWDFRNGNFDVFGYNLGTGTESGIFTSPGEENDFDGWGNVVGTTCFCAGQWDVFTKDLSTGVIAQLTDDAAFDAEVSISGSRLVWTRLGEGTLRIMFHDLATGDQFPLTEPSVFTSGPHIDGDWVTWREFHNGHFDIIAYDLTTAGSTRLPDVASRKRNLDIDAGRIVWQDDRDGDWDVFVYDIAAATERQLTTADFTQGYPKISGDLVVYADGIGDFPEGDIIMYHLGLGVEVPVTSDAFRQATPDVSGNRVVWGDHRFGQWEVFMFEVDAVIPDATDITTVIENALADGSIDVAGIGNALRQKLANAIAAIDRGDVDTARELLEAFIAQVSAQSGKHIDPAVADQLIALAQALLDGI